jgi:hypothetical protein
MFPRRESGFDVFGLVLDRQRDDDGVDVIS